MSRGEQQLTDNEGALLGLVLRVQPVTAYQIAKIYKESPVNSFSASFGKLYPIIKRLKLAGLLDAERVQGDARRTERLVCTSAGQEAIRQWISRPKQGHALLEDPLRTMVQSFDLLTKEQQVEWLLAMKAMFMAKLEELQVYRTDTAIPYKDFVLDNAFSSLRARMDWLDRMLLQVAGVELSRGGGDQPAKVPDAPAG